MSDVNDLSQAPLAATKVALMDLTPASVTPASGVVGQSPLHHVDLAALAKVGPSQGGVQLQEYQFLGHLTLRCNAQSAEQAETVQQILGVELPRAPLSSAESEDLSIYWISPDEWLILVPGESVYKIESAFRAQMVGHYSLVNGSGGSTVINISGSDAVALLKKSSPVDFHMRAFPVGKVVSTVFAKSTAVICRKGASSFDLVIRRSFADYIWLWISELSRESGLVIKA